MLIRHRSASPQNRLLLTQAVYRRAGIPRHVGAPKRQLTWEVPDG